MKNKFNSIAIAIIIISACTMVSCTKAPDQFPTDVPKSAPSFTLSWSYNSNTYRCISKWGSNEYDLYKNNCLVSSTSINDTSSTQIVTNDDNVTIIYDEFAVPNMFFLITDLTIVNDTTVTFVYSMKDQELHEFTMNVSNDAMGNIIENPDDVTGGFNATVSPSGPHFKVFPDGTAKVLLDLSVEAINAGDVNPLYDDAAFLCHLAMTQHINGDHGGSPNSHIMNHMLPSHNGCTLMCNGVSVNFH